MSGKFFLQTLTKFKAAKPESGIGFLCLTAVNWANNLDRHVRSAATFFLLVSTFGSIKHEILWLRQGKIKSLKQSTILKWVGPDREPSKPSKNENREEQARLEEKSQAGTSGPSGSRNFKNFEFKHNPHKPRTWFTGTRSGISVTRPQSTQELNSGHGYITTRKLILCFVSFVWKPSKIICFPRQRLIRNLRGLAKRTGKMQWIKRKGFKNTSHLNLTGKQ